MREHIIKTGYFNLNPASVKEILCHERIERYAQFSSFFDNDDFPYGSANEFLVGSCDIFALALKRRFNYSTWIIKVKGDSATFHVFCITRLKNEEVYIDVRGMTSNFCEFLTNTMFSEKENYEVSPYDTARIEGLRDEWAEVGYQYANAIISDHLEYYKLIDMEDDNS